MKKYSYKKLTSSVILAFTILLGFGSVNVYAEKISLTTENYPPFNMRSKDGSITGISTDIVKELFSRAGVDYEMHFLPWQRAYGKALKEENSAVFSTTRTPEREELFKWVGPIVENNWVLLKKKDSDISLSSLEDAKKYKVGAYSGDATSLFLESEGFKVKNVAKDEKNVLKLQSGRIDLWATGHLLGPYYAKQQGVSGLEPALVFKKTIMSLAFNKSVDDALINKLNTELKKMVAEGVTEKIKSKYQ